MIDHKRDLPIPTERLDHLAQTLYPDVARYCGLSLTERRELLALALQAEQVEYLQRIDWALCEAHEIYNARFR